MLRIVGPVGRGGFVHFVVEDANGDATSVKLYNISSKWSLSQLGKIYRLGSYWVIKEPTIRSVGKGYVILVDSPPDLVRLWPSHPRLITKFKTSPPTTLIFRSPLDHKNKGNALINSSPLDALEHYNLAIDNLTSLATHSTQHDPALLATLYSNRAAARLKLGQPGRALRDCAIAFELPDVSAALAAKLRFRAASACYAMERYGQAQEHLDRVAELAPNDPAAASLRGRVEARQVEVQTGVYDWRALYLKSEAGESLDVACYTNPALSTTAIAGKGRGVVATSAIERGELLFVQRPLASGEPVDKAPRITMALNPWNKRYDGPGRVEVVAKLVDRWTDQVEDRAEIGALWAGSELGRLGEGDQQLEGGASVSRFEAIADLNSFRPHPLTATLSHDPVAELNTPCALYGLPSLVNHGCIANVAYSFVGDVMFARAQAAIAPGAELVLPYGTDQKDLDDRRQALAKYGFECACELCPADERDGPSRRRQRQDLAKQVDGAMEAAVAGGPGDARRQLVRLRDLVGALEGCHSPSRAGLRPLMYSARRLLAAALFGAGQAQDSFKAEADVLRDLGAQFAGSDLARLRMVRAPRVGYDEGVMVALEVAAKWEAVGRRDASRYVCLRVLPNANTSRRADGIG